MTLTMKPFIWKWINELWIEWFILVTLFWSARILTPVLCACLIIRCSVVEICSLHGKYRTKAIWREKKIKTKFENHVLNRKSSVIHNKTILWNQWSDFWFILISIKMEPYGHKPATTINGVVINIHGDSHSTKVGKRIRREASFRVPPPPSFNGAGRASSPTLSSASGSSPYPAPPMNSVPVESARARALQVRSMYFFDSFYL